MIGYLAKPVLLRLFPVAAFGVFDFLIAVVAVGLPVASLKFEDAIVLPEDQEEARDIWLLALLLTALTVGLSALGVFLFGDLVPDPDARLWLWTVPALLLLLRVSKLSELWLTRQKQFGHISAGGVSQSAVTTATRIGLGASGAGVGGLIAGFAGGHLVAASLYTWAALRSLPRSHPFKLRQVARRYRRFALFASPAALVSALATRLPFLVLMAVFGAEVLGWFGQAFNILYVPLSLVGTAVGQVFFVRAAEAYRQGSLTREAAEVHALLVAAAIVPLAGVCAAAPDIFAFVFGEAWRTAGEFAVPLAPWIALSAVASPLTRVFDVMERQRLDLALTTTMFAAMSIALWVGSGFPEARDMVLLLSAAGVVARVLQLSVCLRIAGLSAPEALRPYLRPLVEGALLFAVVYASASFLSPAITTATLAAGLLLWAPIFYKRILDHA
ncbi:MAG: lipopolysaccharide exporter [Rhodothermales bacterium]